MNIRVAYMFIFMTAVAYVPLFSMSEWTIFIEMQAKNDLNNEAKKNLQELTQAHINEDVNVIVQWHKLKEKESKIYQVQHGSLKVLKQSEPVSPGGECVQNLVEGAQYAFNNFPSRYRAIILWGHGSGVYDPMNFSGTTKGILFDYENHTYMNNDQLVKSLRYIVDGGEKIDVIGMDSCLMAMVEIAYEISDYAKYLVSSQDVSPGTGWRYTDILNVVSTNDTTPDFFAINAVLAYDRHYSQMIDWYTQSAINLNDMKNVRDSINEVVASIYLCLRPYKFSTQMMIKKARQNSISFCSNKYVDLYSFCEELRKCITRNVIEFDILKEALFNCQETIKEAVMLSVSGSKNSNVKGLSIYFPLTRIDPQYYLNDFSKESKWIDLFKLI